MNWIKNFLKDGLFLPKKKKLVTFIGNLILVQMNTYFHRANSSCANFKTMTRRTGSISQEGLPIIRMQRTERVE